MRPPRPSNFVPTRQRKSEKRRGKYLEIVGSSIPPFIYAEGDDELMQEIIHEQGGFST